MNVSEPLACFEAARSKALARITDTSLDRAPAGGVDEAARPLVAAINAHARYVTTSTCAGRLVVFCSAPEDAKRGRWLLNSHAALKTEDVLKALRDKKQDDDVIASLKFEPPIAHVRCATLEDARALVKLALELGYRESGILIADSKPPMVAIRSTGAALDAPLGVFKQEWSRLPSDDHVDFLVELANGRLTRSRKKLDELTQRITSAFQEPSETTFMLLVEPRDARRFKVALEAEAALDKSMKISADTEDPTMLALPLRSSNRLPCMDDRVIVQRRRVVITKTDVMAVLQNRAAQLQVELPKSRKKRWSSLGDDALLVPEALSSCFLPEDEVWAAVGAASSVARLFSDAEVAGDGQRTSQRRLLWPNHAHTKVVIREGGLRYSFDAVKTMFCFGNNTERMRHGTLQCAGEVVVDLYAGIGYFSLPLLKQRCSFLHACEWAPAAAASLRENLRLNGFSEDRWRVHEGDNAITAPTLGRIADRVSLGLTPTSRTGWPLACSLLKPTGGVLHLHENVKLPADDSQLTPAENARVHFDSWATLSAAEIEAELNEQFPSERWRCEVLHISRVKDYAPRVHHLVADVKCFPL